MPTLRTEPELQADIAAAIFVNSNGGITETALKTLLENIVYSLSQITFNTMKEYISDGSVTYTAGMCFVYTGIVYQVKTGQTLTGAFNATKVTAITGMITLLYSEMNTLITNSTVVMGMFYYISDKSILGYGSSTNTFEATTYFKIVPKYWNGSTGYKRYDYVVASSDSYTINTAYLVYKQKVYRTINNTNQSSPPDVNTTDFQLQAVTVGTYYQLLSLMCKYDFANDYIYYLEDKLVNKYDLSLASITDHGLNPATVKPIQDYFPWGCPDIIGQTIKNAVVDLSKYAGISKECEYGAGSEIELAIGAENSQWNQVTVQPGAIISNLKLLTVAEDDGGSANICTFYTGSRLVDATIEDWTNMHLGLEWNHTVNTPVPSTLEDKVAKIGFNNVELTINVNTELTNISGNNYSLSLSKAKYAGRIIIHKSGVIPANCQIVTFTNYPELHNFDIISDGTIDSMCNFNITGIGNLLSCSLLGDVDFISSLPGTFCTFRPETSINKVFLSEFGFNV